MKLNGMYERQFKMLYFPSQRTEEVLRQWDLLYVPWQESQNLKGETPKQLRACFIWRSRCATYRTQGEITLIQFKVTGLFPVQLFLPRLKSCNLYILFDTQSMRADELWPTRLRGSIVKGCPEKSLANISSPKWQLPPNINNWALTQCISTLISLLWWYVILYQEEPVILSDSGHNRSWKFKFSKLTLSYQQTKIIWIN